MRVIPRRIVLDSRFRGNDVMPALRLRSGQAPAGIQWSLSLGNPLRTLLRRRANYAQSSTYIGGDWVARGGNEGLLVHRSWRTFDPCPAPACNDQSRKCSTALVG